MDEVSVSFSGRSILQGLNGQIEAGEAVALVGPSGAGKTTFLRLLNATVLPQHGSVWIGPINLARAGPRELRRCRSQVGFIHQDHSLVPNIRVIQNIVCGRLGKRGFWEGLRAMYWPSAVDLNEAYGLLDQMGIAAKLYERTDTLSGGQQQRVAIARALFQQPIALLADEPVASVDPARARDLIALLRNLTEKRNLTLVVSLHDLNLAREFFPRMIGLRQGRVVFDATTREVSQTQYEDLYDLGVSSRQEDSSGESNRPEDGICKTGP